MRSLLVVMLVAGTAAADPTTGTFTLDAIVRVRLAPVLPDGLDVARVHVPASLGKLELDPDRVAVEIPRALRAGRSSVKVTVKGKATQYVPVTIAPVVEVAVAQHALAPGATLAPGDIAIESRAIDGTMPARAAAIVGATVTHAVAANAVIGATDVTLPPPIARGTQVTVEIRRGAVRIRGTATLELGARPGEPATARLAQTRTLVRGTLVAPSTLVVGEP